MEKLTTLATQAQSFDSANISLAMSKLRPNGMDIAHDPLQPLGPGLTVEAVDEWSTDVLSLTDDHVVDLWHECERIGGHVRPDRVVRPT